METKSINLTQNGKKETASFQRMQYPTGFDVDSRKLLVMAHSIKKSIPGIYGESTTVSPLPKINGINGNGKVEEVKFMIHNGSPDKNKFVKPIGLLRIEIIRFDIATAIFKVYDDGIGGKDALQKAIDLAIKKGKEDSLQLA